MCFQKPQVSSVIYLSSFSSVGNGVDIDEYVRRAYKFAYSDCIEVGPVACLPEPPDPNELYPRQSRRWLTSNCFVKFSLTMFLPWMLLMLIYVHWLGLAELYILGFSILVPSSFCLYIPSYMAWQPKNLTGWEQLHLLQLLFLVYLEYIQLRNAKFSSMIIVMVILFSYQIGTWEHAYMDSSFLRAVLLHFLLLGLLVSSWYVSEFITGSFDVSKIKSCLCSFWLVTTSFVSTGI